MTRTQLVDMAGPEPGSNLAVTTRGLAYNPALDGIRAIAVLAVLLWHGTVWWAPGGFLGVDIFFVLSGYLITTLLLEENDKTGRIALPAFWIRRARRLLPALLAVLTLVAVYAAFFAGPLELLRMRGDALASLFFVANWRFVATGQSYFESAFGVPSPFRHMWSLAIEEQFYLLWPPIVAFAFRARHLAWWAVGLGFATLGSATLMLLLLDESGDPSRVYYGTDTRVQALALGAGMAFVLRRWPVERWRPRWFVQLVTIVGTSVTLAMLLNVEETDRWMYRGGFLLVAAGAATMVLAAVTPGKAAAGVEDRRPWRRLRFLVPVAGALDVVGERGAPLVRRALAVPPLPMIGKISYGLYLWHWPIYVWLSSERTGLEDSDLLALRLVVTFAVAIVSYFAIEKPVRVGALSRRAARIAPRRPGIVIAAIGSVIALLLVVTFSVTTREAATAGGGSLRVAITGDSIPYTFFDGVAAGPQVGNASLINASIIGCGFMRTQTIAEAQNAQLIEACKRRDASWADMLHKTGPDMVVMMVGDHEVFDQRDESGKTLVFGTPEFSSRLQLEFADSVKELSATGARVVMLTTPCFRDKAIFGHVERNDDARTAWVNNEVKRFVKANRTRVSLVDLGRFMCPTGTYQPELDGVVLHPDGVHFTPEGAQLVWHWLEPQLEAIAAS